MTTNILLHEAWIYPTIKAIDTATQYEPLTLNIFKRIEPCVFAVIYCVYYVVVYGKIYVFLSCMQTVFSKIKGKELWIRLNSQIQSSNDTFGFFNTRSIL